MLHELFSLGVTAEAPRAIICSKSANSLQRAPVEPTFHVEGAAPINHSFSRKTRLNDLSYGRTDGIAIARPRLHSTQRGKNRSNSAGVCSILLKYGTVSTTAQAINYKCPKCQVKG